MFGQTSEGVYYRQFHQFYAIQEIKIYPKKGLWIATINFGGQDFVGTGTTMGVALRSMASLNPTIDDMLFALPF